MKDKTLQMIKRLFMRSFMFLLLTAVAMGTLELLMVLGRDQISDINSRFPELIVMLRAAFLLSWAEFSIFWIRVTLQPRVDVQQSISVAEQEPTSAAIVHITNTLTWAIRLFVLLKLCEFL